MTEVQRNAFEKVTAFLKANPGVTVSKALKELKIKGPNYYRGRAGMQKLAEAKAEGQAGKEKTRKYVFKNKTRPAPMRIEAAAMPMSSGRIAVFVGEPEVVARMFRL